MNKGNMRNMLKNPYLEERMRYLNLTLDNVVRCLFNYAFVPSPAALAPFMGSNVLDKLLDPNSYVIGIHVRVGDDVWKKDGDQSNIAEQRA
ncbi:hypothetical protein HYH03_018609 [Edaphochlamys debaryana]|uniref:Uncharacterized protein n=1 Tax=Edaphochlamys debaryana TaxID=47281 RepID=A0A835XEB0_9CHLO|nr:hypothetical protein HYH03_018609 [Edaphochlamys debaryana]|eukprot:KAG2482463.1 hypothetical protein HYH03_018609 [Edaphochlamys debaryana]